MENKHTPGPWEATDGSITYCQWNIQTVDKSHKKTFIGEVGGGYHSTSEVEANARLVAAAPDMLEALQILMGEIEKSPTKYTRQEKINIAKSAIKKATT